jgi:hypothetical protein
LIQVEVPSAAVSVFPSHNFGLHLKKPQPSKIRILLYGNDDHR